MIQKRPVAANPAFLLIKKPLMTPCSGADSHLVGEETFPNIHDNPRRSDAAGRSLISAAQCP
jgi:hypothetical protein